MPEHPILFSAPMVRAILEGRKVQTRRLVKASLTEALDFMGGYAGDEHPPGVDLRFGPITGDDGKLGKPQWLACCADYPEEGFVETGNPYGAPGDRLWVRETWAAGKCADGLKPSMLHPGTWLVDNGGLWFPADEAEPRHPISPRGKTRPGMFMPRWASRILLEVTAVRVERLQDISVADCIAEGVPRGGPENPDGIECKEYRALWEQINGPGSWDANPWVWVVEFRRIEA